MNRWQLTHDGVGPCIQRDGQFMRVLDAVARLNELEARLAEAATHTCAMCAEWQGPRRDGTDWGPCEYLSGIRDAAGYEIPDVDLPGYFGCGKWRSKAVME